jgi:6-pyruvoyltetrahydropterin/6-carboxytetrahydropterin synthase
MIMDAAQLKGLVREKVIHDVDHRYLNNQVPWLTGLIPTVEQLCESFWQRLEVPIREICPGVTLMRIRLWETPRIYACKEV